MKKEQLVKVIQFERNNRTWYYTGRHRDNRRTFTTDVNKIPKSGIFRYKLDDLYPKEGFAWRDNIGLELKKVIQLVFNDKIHSEKNVKKIKAVTYKLQPAKYILQ